MSGPFAASRQRSSSSARAGSGPQFVEAATYRFVGHSRSDPGKYRPEGELDRWKQRDPLAVAAERLRDAYGLEEADVAAIRDEAERALDGIEQAALDAPFPEPYDRREFATEVGS